MYAFLLSTLTCRPDSVAPAMPTPYPNHSRRGFLALSASAAVSSSLASPSRAADEAKGGGEPEAVLAARAPFALAPLPYAKNALEPNIDVQTMDIHHGKHHAAYVKNLNDALASGGDAGKKTLGELLSDLSKVTDPKLETAIRNQGGGHYNHALFWSIMGPVGAQNVGGEPAGKIGAAIAKSFGSFADFKTKFSEAAAKRFGSGWAWLIKKADGALAITSTPNQDNPLMKGKVPDAELGVPLMGIDVWEHAYYLKYQNRRPEYIGAWWNVVNWDAVQARL
jgi:Fe-Mn family superoxide dismutase